MDPPFPSTDNDNIALDIQFGHPSIATTNIQPVLHTLSNFNISTGQALSLAHAHTSGYPPYGFQEAMAIPPEPSLSYHPPRRQWPSQFPTVYIVTGFEYMDKL